MTLSTKTLENKKRILKRYEPDLCDGDEEEGRRMEKNLGNSEEDEENKEFYKQVQYTS